MLLTKHTHDSNFAPTKKILNIKQIIQIIKTMNIIIKQHQVIKVTNFHQIKGK